MVCLPCPELFDHPLSFLSLFFGEELTETLQSFEKKKGKSQRPSQRQISLSEALSVLLPLLCLVHRGKKKDKKGRTSPDRETPPFETPPFSGP